MERRKIPVNVESLLEQHQSIVDVHFICHLSSDLLSGDIILAAIYENQTTIFDHGEDPSEMEQFLLELLGLDRFIQLKERALTLAQAQI